MEVRELRVRYELPTGMGGTAVNAVVCEFNTLKCWTDKIKKVGYKLVGIDERFRDIDEWVELDEGWTEIKPIQKAKED